MLGVSKSILDATQILRKEYGIQYTWLVNLFSETMLDIQRTVVLEQILLKIVAVLVLVVYKKTRIARVGEWLQFGERNWCLRQWFSEQNVAEENLDVHTSSANMV